METQEKYIPTRRRIWDCLKISRLPLELLIDFSRIRQRMEVNKWKLSESAFVHHYFDLTFTLRDVYLQNELTADEKSEVVDFLFLFDNLPWKPISNRPNLSELESIELLIPLSGPASRIDSIVAERTEMTLKFMWHRLRNGLPVLAPKNEPIKSQ